MRGTRITARLRLPLERANDANDADDGVFYFYPIDHKLG
jgi:hypothetical protein